MPEWVFGDPQEIVYSKLSRMPFVEYTRYKGYTMITLRVFTEEFKHSAVDLAKKPGNICAPACELGLAHSQLRCHHNRYSLYATEGIHLIVRMVHSLLTDHLW